MVMPLRWKRFFVTPKRKGDVVSAYLVIALLFGATKHVPMEQAQAICAGYGLPAGTAEYTACVKVEHEGFEPKRKYDLGDPYAGDYGVNGLSSRRSDDDDDRYLPPSLDYHP